jgi:phage replication O-like protein O
MANPQLENGRCEFANELVDALIKTHFNPLEFTIFMTVARQTYSWHKKWDRISFTQFEEKTGVSRRHIAPVLQGLIKRNIIARRGEGYNLEYSIQKDYELWKSLPKRVTKIITESSNESLPNQVINNLQKSLPNNVQSLPNNVPIITESSNEIVTESCTHKSNKAITKANIQKQYSVPDFIKKEIWEAFEETRKKLRAPMTDTARNLIVKDLERIRGETGDDPNEVLNQSIMRGWRGVFQLKNRGNENGRIYGQMATGVEKRQPANVTGRTRAYSEEEYDKPLE